MVPSQLKQAPPSAAALLEPHRPLPPSLSPFLPILAVVVSLYVVPGQPLVQAVEHQCLLAVVLG